MVCGEYTPYSPQIRHYSISPSKVDPVRTRLLANKKRICYDGAVMARRPQYLKNDSMTEEELRQLHRNLLLLSPNLVQQKYKTLVDRCRFLELPTPRIMQELVTTWKVLWRWRR